MNRIFTILKTGISCAFIIFVLQLITYRIFIERFEEFFGYSPFLKILLKTGIIIFVIYLFFSILIFSFFNYIPGNFLSKSFLLMIFFIVFKTIPVVLNLFLSSNINLTFILIFGFMNLLSDVISSFIFTGMYSEAVKSKVNEKNNIL